MLNIFKIEKRTWIAWILSLFVVFLIISPLAFAQTDPGNPAPTGPTDPGNPAPTGPTDPGNPGSPGVTPDLPNPLRVGSISEFVTAVIRLMITIGIPIATLFIIYAGFKFVTAGGNENKISEAKQMLLWTIVGTGVLLGASIIANVIKNTITNI